jgi:uncharacterized protein (DUF58 family)
MPIRRRAWLTREGWYYSTVLGFIIGGAVLRNVNLLVVLTGIMIATLLINWRLVMASLTGLVIRRRLPNQILAGEPLTVEFSVENSRRWMSSWLLTVEDWVEPSHLAHKSHLPSVDTAPRARLNRRSMIGRLSARGRADETAHAVALVPHVRAVGQATGTYRLTLHRRGRYRFGPLRVSTSFPLGLVRGHMMLPQRGELIVSPRLGRLLPQWANLLEAELMGDHRRHPQRGISEGDYYGLRPWQSGDSLRWVHWRTTARLGRPVVRQYERRRSRDVAIVLDCWLPDSFTEEDEGRVEMAISLAATAIADITGRGQSRLAFAIAGPETQCFSGPSSTIFCQELLERLADVVPRSDFSLSAALLQAVEEAPRGALLVVVSSRAANDRSLADASAELPIDPSEMVWIDAGSDQLNTLFCLD